MALQRKLGRATDVRKSILQGLVTTLILDGKVQTTTARAKEVKRIAEKLITLAVKEKDNFTTKEIVASQVKLDGKGKKVLESKTSKNGKKYDVVQREVISKTVTVDNPSRLAARKRAMLWLKKGKKADGTSINPTNKLFDEVAPKYAGRPGGYTRIVQIGVRRGDAAEMAILELI